MKRARTILAAILVLTAAGTAVAAGAQDLRPGGIGIRTPTPTPSSQADAPADGGSDEVSASRGPTAPKRRIDHVLELFTSQGCSSCPPADRLLTDLSRRSGILALAYHVDYWDYIGWRDPFGSKDNTDRQSDYARAFATSTLYTPQLIVDGTRRMVGSRADEVRSNLAASAMPPGGVDAAVDIAVMGKRLHITARANGMRRDEPMPVLILVTYAGDVRTYVARGENAGRTMVNTHPVLDWRVLGMWQGKPMIVDLPVDAITKRLEEARRRAAPEGAAEREAADAKAGGSTGNPGIESVDGTQISKGGCAVLLQRILPNGAPGPVLAADRVTF